MKKLRKPPIIFPFYIISSPNFAVLLIFARSTFSQLIALRFSTYFLIFEIAKFRGASDGIRQGRVHH
jgi:hypothetical protein